MALQFANRDPIVIQESPGICCLWDISLVSEVAFGVDSSRGDVRFSENDFRQHE